LKRVGITRVRPLKGGLNLWVDLQYPTEQLTLTEGASTR
jgi:3-mercaptopyruvate sulfurtransferase SseA